MNDQYTPQVGETVRAFHPRTMGVVKTGKVVRVVQDIGSDYAVIDFGELLGGRQNIPLPHVLGPTD